MDNFQGLVNKYLRDFKKIDQKKQIIIIAILIGSFVFGILIPVAVSNLTYKKSALPAPSPTSIPIPASLTLSADSASVKLGATFSATININSPNQGVDAADFIVDFDPQYLKVATVSGGNYFGLFPVKSATESAVKITGIANLVNNRFIIPIGEGTIGTITFQTLSATGNTDIKFDREKTIVASKGENILDQNKITDLQIMIK